MGNRVRIVAGLTFGVALVVGLAAHGLLFAQAAPDAEIKKVADAFVQAWGKGDAKAIAALHTKDGVRLTGNGEPAAIGTAAIEQAMITALTGAYKGTTLTVTANANRRVTDDVYVGEGTYQVTGGAPPAGAPTRGQYMNTLVRQGGRWMIAASAIMPATMAK